MISTNNNYIYHKNTHFSSFELFQRKTAWVKSLFRNPIKISSSTRLLDNQIKTIKSFISWSGYPHRIIKFVNKFNENATLHSQLMMTC